MLLAGKTDPLKPVLEEWQVYKKLQKSKKPNSVVPGDLPVKLVKEFNLRLALQSLSFSIESLTLLNTQDSG